LTAWQPFWYPYSIHQKEGMSYAKSGRPNFSWHSGASGSGNGAWGKIDDALFNSQTE